MRSEGIYVMQHLYSTRYNSTQRHSWRWICSAISTPATHSNSFRHDLVTSHLVIMKQKYTFKLTFSLRAFLLKKALHDSHEIASKLQPRARSPQTRHSLSSFNEAFGERALLVFSFPPPRGRSSAGMTQTSDEMVSPLANSKKQKLRKYTLIYAFK